MSQETIIICGVQLKCKGAVAVGEVIFPDGMTIPACEACGMLTAPDEDDTLDETHGDVA